MTTAIDSHPYHIITSRGREARAASLQGAVGEAAFLERAEAQTCVTVGAEGDPRAWYVYASQASLETDARRGPIGASSPGWIAIVRDLGRA